MRGWVGLKCSECRLKLVHQPTCFFVLAIVEVYVWLSILVASCNIFDIKVWCNVHFFLLHLRKQISLVSMQLLMNHFSSENTLFTQCINILFLSFIDHFELLNMFGLRLALHWFHLSLLLFLGWLLRLIWWRRIHDWKFDFLCKISLTLILKTIVKALALQRIACSEN